MLQGIRIVEIEGLGPGPFAGMLLADLGADVIVVHRKGGRPAPGIPDRAILDRGKRSIELDLKDQGDVATLKRLLRRAAGLIEGFRPGVMERLGLGPAECHAVNPALVYGRMTGWGQDGPLSRTAGHDLNYIAMSGAAWFGSGPDEAPFTPPTLVGDIGGGAMYLAVGLLAGILKAQATGLGSTVDAAIFDGSAHMMNLLMTMWQAGSFQSLRGASILDGPHWSRCYRTADGGFVSVQCLEPKFYAVFLEKLGLQDDPAFARQFDQEQWPELTNRLAGIFALKNRDDWTDMFSGSDACVAPVLNPEEASASTINAVRGTWQSVDGALQARPAPRITQAGKTPQGWSPPSIPQRGEHGAEILAELEELD